MPRIIDNYRLHNSYRRLDKLSYRYRIGLIENHTAQA